MTFSEVLLQHYGSFIAAGFLVTLLINIALSPNGLTFRNKLFILIIIMNLLTMIIEVITFAAENRDASFYYYLNITSNNILFLYAPITGGLFASYVDYVLHRDRTRLVKYWYFMQPAIIVAIALLINLFTPIVFSISSAGVYTREAYYLILIVPLYLLFIHVFGVTAMYKPKGDYKLLIGVGIYLFGPILASIFQLFFKSDLLLIYPVGAMATVFAYLTFESTNGSTEFFTKLFTRERATFLISDKLSNNDEFSIIMFDIDNFKYINDTYGHAVGDEAILFVANSLKNHFKSCLVSRWGGDEFIVISTMTNYHTIISECSILQKEMTESQNIDIEEISFSMGFSIHEKDENKSMESLIVEADQMMYRNKKENARLRRRSSDR